MCRLRRIPAKENGKNVKIIRNHIYENFIPSRIPNS